jgi:hypothetical protein
MNALIFVHKLWSDHEPLLRDELSRTNVKSSLVRTLRLRHRSELCSREKTQESSLPEVDGSTENVPRG